MATPPKAQSTRKDASRDRSTIQFPYMDLDDGVAVADAIYRNVGAGSATTDQVAAWTGHQTVRSGTFRLRLASARLFQFITSGEERISLTSLGRRVVDPGAMASAKVEAFLNVPLYKRLYERYRGELLPPDTALEREMAQLGVAPKQVAKARQVFQRSATHAGYFDAGRNRLVAPNVRDAPGAKPATPGQPSPGPAGTAMRISSAMPHHPFIQGLLQTLPEPGTNWPETQRRQWLDTAEGIFNLIYPSDANSRDGDARQPLSNDDGPDQ
jgi:hypothetical protein